MQKKRSPHRTYVQQGQRFPTVGLGRLELPTSRLSDISRALVGARERWKQGDLADFALVGASQRWPALLQVLLQPSHRESVDRPVSVSATDAMRVMISDGMSAPPRYGRLPEARLRGRA